MTRLTEHDLREALTRVGDQPPVPPLPLDDVIADGSRRRRRILAVRVGGTALAVAAVVAAVAVPIANSNAPSPASSGGNAPTPAAPTPSSSAPQIRVPHCQAGDLRLAPGTPISPVTGEIAATYAIVNTSTSACSVFGVPHIELLSANGDRLPLKYTHKATEYVPAQHPRRVVLNPGGTPASLLVAKYRCDGGARTHAARVRVSVRGGTVTGPVGNTEIAYCNGGSNDPGQVVAVSAFTGPS